MDESSRILSFSIKFSITTDGPLIGTMFLFDISEMSVIIVIGFLAASSSVLSSVTSPRYLKCGVLVSSNTISYIALSCFLRSDFLALSSTTIYLEGFLCRIGLLVGLLLLEP